MRISVTDLDSFLYWRETEDAPVEELLARLRRESPPTPEMIAGRALHSLLEHVEEMEVFDVADFEHHRFMFNIDIDFAIPQVRELKGELELKTDAGLVTLVGVVDGLDGREIRDFKLSEEFKPDRYMDSYQWRCYLTMFNARSLRYDVFVGRRTGTAVGGDPVWTITDLQSITMHAYPDMFRDVHAVVSEFAEFLQSINFQFPPRRKPDASVAEEGGA